MSEKIAGWLVKAKVSPPSFLVNSCRREALLKRLSTYTHNRVTLLEAPAGFGKTLLLSQWREDLRTAGCFVAWLSVTEDDEPDILLSYLAFAFHQGGLDMTGTRLLTPSTYNDRPAYRLGRLLNAIERAGSRCVLMLDDFERISEESLADVVQPLVQISAENLHMVFACRKNPGLSLSQIAVHGILATVGPQQLRFDRSEVQQMFGGTLAKRDLDSHCEYTGGWPVALQLIRSFGDRTMQNSRELDNLAGGRLEAKAYFEEQLARNLPEEEREFLQDTSVLDLVRIDCANHIRGANDSLNLAQRLHFLNGLFAQLEEDEQAYRLHPMLREFFYERLREVNMARFVELHRAAAWWFANTGQHIEGMRHALAAEDVSLAGAIFDGMLGGPLNWLQEGMSRLRAGLKLLADQELSDHPRIHLARSLNFAKAGKMRQARESFAQARHSSHGFTRDRPGGDTVGLLIERFYIGALLAGYGCTLSDDPLDSEASRFILEHTANQPIAHGVVMAHKCVTSMQSGAFTDVRRYGKAAIEDYRVCNSLYGELFIYLHFGMSELAYCNTAKARAEYEIMVRMVRSHFPGDTRLRHIGDVVFGELCWEKGDEHGAKKHLKHLISHVHHAESWFDIYMAAYRTVAEFLAYSAGPEAALHFLDRARVEACCQDMRRLAFFIDCVAFSVLCRAGWFKEARTQTDEMTRRLANPPFLAGPITWREVEASALAGSHLAELQDDPAACNHHLATLIAEAVRTGNQRLRLYGLVRKAAYAVNSGDKLRATAALAEAVEIAAPGRYLRPFLLELNVLMPVLEELSRDLATTSRKRECVDELLRRGVGTDRALTNPAEFGQREIEVLQELSRGAPDKVIARRMGLTVAGVRYHLNNIYAKMAVGNRIQAIARARELGLFGRTPTH
jgi:LuxR family maltose regulon positive regulatory protein